MLTMSDAVMLTLSVRQQAEPVARLDQVDQRIGPLKISFSTGSALTVARLMCTNSDVPAQCLPEDVVVVDVLSL
jgi:hypothetical protein